MKILLQIPLSPFTGYGNDGIGLSRALMRWGCDVRISPTVVQPPLPEDISPLLTKPLEAPFDLIITHVDPAALNSSEEQQRSATAVVGWTMWEYSTLDNLPGRSLFSKKTKYLDAIYAYDEVSAGAIRTRFKRPVPIVQGGFEPERWPEVERDWNSDRFGFFMLGQLHERKDPFVAIEAFNELKHEEPDFGPAELHLKTTVPGLHKAMEQVYDKLRIHYDVWPEEVQKIFYSKQHVLLSPSRGEGKNMPALEFQSTGGIVIATDWGGHQQWLHRDYALPLDYVLRPVSPEFPTALNARASVEDLKSKMLWAFRHRAEAKQMGHLAAQVIPKLCSWDSVVERFFQKLPEALPDGRGAQLQQLAMAAKWGDQNGHDRY